MKDIIEKLGRGYLISINALYHFTDLDKGWRATDELSGALFDLGYHFIDILFYLLGNDLDFIECNSYQRFGDLKNLDYLSDDTACIDGVLYNGKNQINLHMILSRIYPIKKVSFMIAGQSGIIKYDNGTVRMYNSKGDLDETYSLVEEDVLQKMFCDIYSKIRSNSLRKNKDEIEKDISVVKNLRFLYERSKKIKY